MKKAWQVTAIMHRPKWLNDGEPMTFTRMHFTYEAAVDDKLFVEKHFPGSEMSIEEVPFDHTLFFSDDDTRTQREKDEESIIDKEMYPHRFPPDRVPTKV